MWMKLYKVFKSINTEADFMDSYTKLKLPVFPLSEVGWEVKGFLREICRDLIKHLQDIEWSGLQERETKLSQQERFKIIRQWKQGRELPN